MDVTFLKDWFAVAGGVLGVGGALYAWLTRDGNKALGAIDELKREMTAVEKRVSSIEAELKHLPTKEDLDDLKDRLADLSKEVAVSNKSMEAMQNVIKRVDDFVMRAGK